MAEALKYTPPPAPQPGAEEELQHLIEVLYESGTLRTLIGFFGRLGKVNDVALTEINSEPGKNILGALLFLGQALSKLPAEDLTGVAQGLERGVSAAEQVVREKPPTLLGLVRLAREPDTRRALAALLAIANRVGSQLGHSKDP